MLHYLALCAILLPNNFSGGDEMAAGIRGLEIGAGRSYAPSRARLVVVGVVLTLAATAVDVILAMVLRSALGVPAGFSPLQTPAVASMTIVGMIGATVVFGWMARVRPDPRAAFVRIALAALVLSWLPDLVIWVAGVFPHTTGTGILSLMALHPVAAAFAIGILYRFGLQAR
jgi:Family of unknown function (DUF6069)